MSFYYFPFTFTPQTTFRTPNDLQNWQMWNNPTVCQNMGFTHPVLVQNVNNIPQISPYQYQFDLKGVLQHCQNSVALGLTRKRKRGRSEKIDGHPRKCHFRRRDSVCSVITVVETDEEVKHGDEQRRTGNCVTLHSET